MDPILAALAGALAGGLVSMIDRILAGRSERKERFDDKLRESYIEYWRGVELVERQTVRLVGLVDEAAMSGEPLDEDKFREQTGLCFDARAPYSIGSAKVEMLEASPAFLGRVEEINDHIKNVMSNDKHCFDLDKAKELSVHTDKLLNELVTAINCEHPRLAVRRKPDSSDG